MVFTQKLSTSALIDAFEPVSELRYNVSLLGLRSLQKTKVHVLHYNDVRRKKSKSLWEEV